VGDPHPRREVDPAAGLPDAVVHLPVLGADERFVVAADPLERAAPERPEVDGLDLAGLAAGVEPGVADAELGRHRAGHGLLERGDALGRHDPADVVGAGLLHRLDRGPDVVGRQQRVAVHPDDDRVLGRLDRDVETLRGAPGRVRDDQDARVLGGELAGDLLGAVAAGADGEHEFQLAGVVLGEDAAHGVGQMALLVEDRHHHRDGGPGAFTGVGAGLHGVLDFLVHGALRVGRLVGQDGATLLQGHEVQVANGRVSPTLEWWGLASERRPREAAPAWQTGTTQVAATPARRRPIRWSATSGPGRAPTRRPATPTPTSRA